MVYSYREKFGYSIPASTVGAEFEKIEARDGKVTNRAVLDSARPISSPIHNIFEWDDMKAAEAYRLRQATMLICNVVVVSEPEESKKPITVRAYVNVSNKKEGEFISVYNAFSDEEMREKVLSDAMNELASFKRKYANLKEFSKLFEVIDEMNVA